MTGTCFRGSSAVKSESSSSDWGSSQTDAGQAELLLKYIKTVRLTVDSFVRVALVGVVKRGPSNDHFVKEAPEGPHVCLDAGF